MTYVTWGFDDLDLPGKTAPARRSSTLAMATAITLGLGGATAILNLASSSATWMAVAYLTAGQENALRPKQTTLGVLSPRGQAFALPGDGVILASRPQQPAPIPAPDMQAVASPSPKSVEVAQPPVVALAQPPVIEEKSPVTPTTPAVMATAITPPSPITAPPASVEREGTAPIAVPVAPPLPPTRLAALAPVPVSIVLPEPVRRTSIRKPEEPVTLAPPVEPTVEPKPIIAPPQKPNPLVAALPPKVDAPPLAPQRPGPVAGNGTAVYDIEARTVYLPNGERLEAHSGLGEHMDDPRSAPFKMRGVTPPNTYKLSMRESLFHGVAAIRLTPIGDSPMYNRDGLLAHTFMLGGNGASNGCISFRDYNRFLTAFQRGEISKIVVVARHGGAAPGGGVGRFFASVAAAFTPGDRDSSK